VGILAALGQVPERLRREVAIDGAAACEPVDDGSGL
jgi:hypothetical protein